MVTPFSKYQKIEDIEPLMDKEEKLLYPLVDNTIIVLHKIIDPFEEDIPLFDKNEATIVGLFIKQTKLLADFYNAYKADNIHLCLLLSRVLYEAYIKMSYLIIHGEGLYNSLYAIMSDSIHSDWGETRQVYLTKHEENGMYSPNDAEIKHGRLLVPTIQIAIGSSFKYINWMKHNSFLYERIALLQPILTEMNRMFQLIGNYYMYTYMNNPEKYMYE